ncbi:hypothetical protein [Nocardioides pacificus]
MWFWILLGLVAAAVVVYKFRVPILAKVLGQPPARIERHLERRAIERKKPRR